MEAWEAAEAEEAEPEALPDSLAVERSADERSETSSLVAEPERR